MSDITYTRITPEGEEKCSLRNGDGMTIEEMEKAVDEYCDNFDLCSDGPGCILRDKHGRCRFETAGVGVCYNILVKAGLIKPPVNFVKANPDDEVNSVGDAVDSDAVHSPTHYCKGGIECIDAIKASMTADGFMDYCKGNIIKYLWRWRDKGGVEDLKKAKVYLEWLIEEAEK